VSIAVASALPPWVMLYTQLISFESNQFYSATHISSRPPKLIEAGFEYVCDFEGDKLFRKRK
jgi:hypothetical protein